MIIGNPINEFAKELEKLSAKTIPVKGAKGRRNKDGLARISKPLPEPKEVPGMTPKLPSIRKRHY